MTRQVLLGIVLAAVLAGCCYHMSSRQGQAKPAPIRGEPIVRVRLTAALPVTITSSRGLAVAAGDRRVHLAVGRQMVLDQGVTVAVSGQHWAGRFDTVRCQPDRDGLLRVGSREYRGEVLVFSTPDGGTAVVNQLPLEEYVAGVVPCEIGPINLSTTEAVKAQAVAARSFTLARIQRRRFPAYDVLDSYARDQEYRGVGSENMGATEAVRATRGEVLTYGGDVIEALYHANCGGATGNGSQPYLRAVYDSPGQRRGRPAYCAGQPSSSWRSVVSRDSIERVVARFAGRRSPPTLRRVRIDSDQPSGRVVRARFDCREGEFSMPGTALRTALGLRSQSFRISLERSRALIDGRGSGHGVGMCQNGAVGMARAGVDYRTILHHYYHGVSLQRRY